MAAIQNNEFLAKTRFKKNYQITDNYLNEMLTDATRCENEDIHILIVSFGLLIYLFLVAYIYSSYLKAYLTA